ncbi:MAG: LamG-like jellyroll fold domain-containing protein [Bacteroidia bacterium]
MKQKILLFPLLILITTLVQAQTNQYLHFDRVNDYVRLDNGSQYIAGKSAFSMAGWFYTDQLAYGQGMMGFRGTGEGFYLIQLNNGTLECRLQTSTGLHEVVGPNFTILPGQWQYVAWVYDGASVKLYIDGVNKGSKAASGQITMTNIPFTIGRSILTNLNFYFGGRADEVSVWDKALSQAEIQTLMVTEPAATDPNLQLYYKFNQGQPCADNTAITKLISETGTGDRDADLIGFSLSGGCNSNFAGTLQVGFQTISFATLPNKLISDQPFALDATASSGLPVTFQIVSGPATLNGDTLILDGTPGQVVVTASQPGDTVYGPATDVTQSFMVVDPMATVPNIDLRNPLPGNVYVPELKPIQLAAIADIDFPELLQVASLEFEIDGTTVPAKDWGNKHYTAWWTPPAHSLYNLTVRAFNDFGAAATYTVPIIISPTPNTQTINAFSNIWINSTVFNQEVEAALPGFVGAYDSISAQLQVTCPTGGCGEWDRVASIEVKTHEGEWFEMIRYITPYGTACSHTLDVTDFMSALQGKVTFRVNCETFDNGYLYKLNLYYHSGTPTYAYSKISPVWHKTYDFGNPANIKPVIPQTIKFPVNTVASTFKLIATGHGWGNNNTSNAAEFFETTHHIWVDNNPTFAHHNWLTCNPNPDACQPQNGTWFYNRAGFCPGAISPWYDYDMSNYINNSEILLDYVFDQTYVDLCHANNPNCVSGVTCPDCSDGFNPHLIVASSMIHFSDMPMDSVTTDIDELETKASFRVYPNPSSGQVEVELTERITGANLVIVNSLGVEVRRIENVQFQNQRISLDLSELAAGMYIVMLDHPKARSSRILYLTK